MKIGRRGQVTIPKEILEKFGLRPETEVEFRMVGAAILLVKTAKKLELEKWKGQCRDSFAELAYTGKHAVDSFIDDVRGR